MGIPAVSRGSVKDESQRVRIFLQDPSLRASMSNCGVQSCDEHLLQGGHEMVCPECMVLSVRQFQCVAKCGSVHVHACATIKSCRSK